MNPRTPARLDPESSAFDLAWQPSRLLSCTLKLHKVRCLLFLYPAIVRREFPDLLLISIFAPVPAGYRYTLQLYHRCQLQVIAAGDFVVQSLYLLVPGFPISFAGSSKPGHKLLPQVQFATVLIRITGHDPAMNQCFLISKEVPAAHSLFLRVDAVVTEGWDIKVVH